jgi:ubiquitin-conjugating enzyme E2 S
MLTKIFHPNVSAAGEICVNTLKKDWKPTYGIEHILVTVKCLLIYPNAESALDEDAGKELLENYEGYFARAKLITSVHATTPKVRFSTPLCPLFSVLIIPNYSSHPNLKDRPQRLRSLL